MSEAAAPRVAVIIVNYNGGAMLARCLEALGRQSYRDFRTVVVDNASADGSADGLEARFPGIEVVRAGRNLGFAAGNNLGLRHARGAEWVALLNPDAYAEPGWLQALMRAADAGQYDFFGCRMRLADHPDRLDGTADVYHVSGLAWRRDHGAPAAGAGAAAGEIFGPCAAAALYRRADIEAAGGFDEAYFCYFEDVDLAFRLRLAGLRCGYVPEASVDHVSSGIAGRRSDFSTYHGHRNLVWTYFKDMPATLLWRYLPMHIAANLVAIAVCAGRGQLGVILRAKRDALAGLPRVLRERRAVQARRRASAGALRSAMARGLGAVAGRR